MKDTIMISPAVRNENIKKLRELMQGIPVAMLTTVDDSTGRLRSRPMAAQKKPFDGTLWFFTYGDAPKADDVRKEQDVVVTYTNKDKNFYMSVSGKGTVERDLAKMEEFWFGGLTSWFPRGMDDPQLALMKIEVQEAEYWDGLDNRMQKLVGFVRAFASREAHNGNINEKLELM
jgi:general stress protein 26